MVTQKLKTHRQQMGILTMMRQRLLPNCKIKSDERGMILSIIFSSFVHLFADVCSLSLCVCRTEGSSNGAIIVTGSFSCSFSLKWSTYEFIHYDYVARYATLIHFSYFLFRFLSSANEMIFTDTKNCVQTHNLLSDLLKIHITWR